MSRGRRPGSPFIREALDRISALRDDFRDIRLAYYVAAETATNGRMLNRRGVHAGIDPMELLARNMTSIRAYGSEELLEWIAQHPRLTFAQFEREMFNAEEQDPWTT